MPYCKNGSAARTPTNVVAPAQFVRLSPRWMSSPWAALLSFEAIGRTDGVVEMGMDGEKVFSDRLKDQQIHRLKVPMQEARVVSDATGRSSAEPSETEPEPRGSVPKSRVRDKFAERRRQVGLSRCLATWQMLAATRSQRKDLSASLSSITSASRFWYRKYCTKTPRSSKMVPKLPSNQERLTKTCRA